MIRSPASPSPTDNHPAWDALVVDVEPDSAVRLAAFLRAGGHRPTIVPTVAAARTELDRRPVDLICLALDPSGGVGGEAVRQLRGFAPTADVVIVAPTSDAGRVLQAIRHGASDHLPTPVTPAALELVLARVADRRRLARQLRSVRAELDDDPDADFPTDTPDIRHLLAIARRVAASSAPVLIVGEPGTGKGRWARAIHAWSGRAAGPLAVVPCAPADAGSTDTLDLDLFGGTGPVMAGPVMAGPTMAGLATAALATAHPHGHVALCRGGTLVVDRVGDLPLALQPRLLRLIADHQYERRDEHRPRPADVRVVATAADDLVGAVRAGRFRDDLRLALDVVRIDLPPLRDRPRDIPLLADRYLAHAARQQGRAVTGLTPEAMALLARHAWPGNLRELRNVVERAVLVATADRIEPADLPHALRGGSHDRAPAHMPGDLVPLRTLEDQHIRRVLATVGNARAAAAVLGIDPSTLWRRLRPRPANVTSNTAAPI